MTGESGLYQVLSETCCKELKVSGVRNSEVGMRNAEKKKGCMHAI